MADVVLTEVEQKKAKFGNWIKVAALGVVGLLVAPFIMMAIGGLIGLAVAAAVGFVLVQLAPWFALKVANYKYRLMDAEKVEHIKQVVSAAEQNPIETLTSLLIAKKAAFQVFLAAVDQAITARSNFWSRPRKASSFPCALSA